MRILCLALIIFTFSSCLQKRFIHNAAPAINPMLKEKGEAFASGYYHTNGATRVSGNVEVSHSSSNGINFQGGYALSNHFAIIGAVNYLDQKNQYNGLYSEPFDTSRVSAKRTEFTAAADYFLTSDNKKAGFHLLGGFTFGKYKLSDDGRDAGLDYNRYFNANSLFIFLQPGFMVYSNEHSGFGLFTKASYVSYQNIKTSYDETELSSLRLNNTAGFYTFEMGGKLAVGFDKLPLSIDGQLSYIYSHSGRVHVRRANFSVGASYYFAAKKKKS